VPSIAAVYGVVTRFHATGSVLERTPVEYVLTEEKPDNVYGAQLKIKNPEYLYSFLALNCGVRTAVNITTKLLQLCCYRITAIHSLLPPE